MARLAGTDAPGRMHLPALPGAVLPPARPVSMPLPGCHQPLAHPRLARRSLARAALPARHTVHRCRARDYSYRGVHGVSMISTRACSPGSGLHRQRSSGSMTLPQRHPAVVARRRARGLACHLLSRAREPVPASVAEPARGGSALRTGHLKVLLCIWPAAQVTVLITRPVAPEILPVQPHLTAPPLQSRTH